MSADEKPTIMRFMHTIGHEGEPTGKTFPLRTETIQDLLFTVPAERIPQALAEIMSSTLSMAELIVALQASGTSMEEIREGVKLPDVLPWVDDGKAECGFKIVDGKTNPEEPSL